MKRAGFLINPIAGMGGRVGLKGTDDVVSEAIALGARPTANLKAGETLAALHKLLQGTTHAIELEWLTCSGPMGADALKDSGFRNFQVVHEAGDQTTSDDTETAVRSFLDLGVNLILFCGGDGTARDVCAVAGERVPIVGIPSGVKMFSGVFGINADRTAEIIVGFLEGRLRVTKADVLDLDEAAYRRGEWVVRLYYAALTPYEPTLTQSAKLLISETTDAEAKAEIARHLLEEIETNPDVLFLLGPGSTVQSIGNLLGIDKTLLGVDAVAGGKMVAKDVNERGILDLLDRYPARNMVLSPIGAQGFILGRGNLQLSPEVVRRIGSENLIVVATPAKLARTARLRFDTGDAILDAELAGSGYVPVVIGYRLRRLAKIEI